MTTQQQIDGNESRMKSGLLMNIAILLGLGAIVACQVLFLRLTSRQRERTPGTAQDGPAGSPAPGTAVTSSHLQLAGCSDDDLPDAVALVRPAIVNIDVASSDVGPAAKRGGPALNFDMPRPEALKTNEETLGSGIIVDPRGFILTCYHLIKGHAKVHVTLFSSDRKTYKADVVDVDIANDLALLRIHPDSPVPAVRLGNSDLVKITDTVLAIGSPFGFEHTVTAGIISDSKRSVVIDGRTYSQLFQTDASINRGSAGGALISTDGDVIGVNTAIASTSGYFAGISFAIPINRARFLLMKAMDG